MGGGRAVAGGGIGLLALLAIGYFFGIDVTPLIQENGSNGTGETTELTDADRQAGEFVSVVLRDTEKIWSGIFRDQLNGQYHPATLVLCKGVTQSPCGDASGATGPFYCPNDKKVYLDTNFFTTLSRQLGAAGDFANAYVVAHEVAHHVQDEIGLLSKANNVRAQVNEAESNAISVRIELQADCYSGIWARHVEAQFGTLEEGDVHEALNAAKQIGDNMLQRNAGRVPQPHTFTHGTSEQRQRWFATGYKTGDMRACDTFGVDRV
jgi:predicted metalloprotease